MKRNIYFSLFIIPLLTLAVGCTSPVRTKLNKAKKFMVDYPDSALAIVGSVDKESLSTPEEKALYALRMVEAKYYGDDPDWANDGYINKAVSYYSEHPGNPDAAMAFYLAGIRNRDLGKTTQAINYFTESAVAAERNGDWLRVSLANQRLAKIYYYKGRLYPSLYHSRRGYNYAVSYDGKDREEYIEDAEVNLALAYFNNNMIDSSLFIVTKILNQKKFLRPDTHYYLLSLRGRIMDLQDKPEEALEDFEEVRKNAPLFLDKYDLVQLGLLYYDRNDFRNVAYVDSLLSTKEDGSKILSALIARKENRLNDAIDFMIEEYYRNHQRIFQIGIENNSDDNALFDKLKAQIEINEIKERNKNERIWWTAIGLFLALGLTGIFSYLWRYRKQTGKLENSLADKKEIIKGNEELISKLQLEKHDILGEAKNLQYENSALKNRIEDLDREHEECLKENARLSKLIDFQNKSKNNTGLSDPREHFENFVRFSNYLETQVKKANESGSQYNGAIEIRDILREVKELYQYDNTKEELIRFVDKMTDGLISEFSQTHIGQDSKARETLVFMLLRFKPGVIAGLEETESRDISLMRSKLKTDLNKENPELFKKIFESRLS